MTPETAPDWWRRGQPLDAAARAQLDVSEFLEDDEHDYPWRLCRTPAAAFDHARMTAAQLRQRLLDFALGNFETPDDEAWRLARIRDWFDAEGVERALAHRPPVVLLRPSGALNVLDGHHRLHVLIHERNATEILAAVGLADREAEDV